MSLRILALDASTEWCSAALGDDSGFVERRERAGQRHSELILPMVRSLLAEAGAKLAELDGIAFGAGPGSFTGLRIACGVAQGLAHGAALAVVAVPTLEAMAETARVRGGHPRIYAALDARMGEVYVAAYEFAGGRWIARIDATVIAPDAAPVPGIGDWKGAGPGFDAYPALRERLGSVLRGVDASIEPAASAIGALALPRLAAGEVVAAGDAAPLYVRHRVALTSAERAAGALLVSAS
ncbi:MAG: tRNA (adenosine(37)-N6)-threonylcarbamoyltransferase complex dimerization subunit type 1 TsaB [Betaproteobacteria bacterium]